MDMQRIMNNENYIRTGGIGENFFIPMMENQDYRHKIENEISLRLGGKKNFEMSLEERAAVEQRKVEKCKNSWRKMVDSYLDLANEPIENLDVKFKPYDFKEWEAQLGKELYIVTESQTAVGKLGVAQELLNEQNEKTRYSEQKGKNTWMQYGFDKEAVFNAMMSNAGKAKEEQIAIPQPRLRELSLRDKIKKRFTGKCQVDEDNKKIQAQYNRFVAQVQQLSEGWDFNCCPCAPTTFDRLDEFIKTAEKGFEQKLVAFNRDLWEYKMAKEEDRIEKKVVYEFNQKNQDEVSKVVELRKQKEIEKKNHEEKKAVEQAEKVVNKISDNQFRDVDVAKDSKGKEATAKERYLARKILKDRGLLQSKSQSSVKTAISKEMMQGHKNSAGR